MQTGDGNDFLNPGGFAIHDGTFKNTSFYLTTTKGAWHTMMASRASGSLPMIYIGQCSPVYVVGYPGGLINRSFYGYMTDMVTFSASSDPAAYSTYFASQTSSLTGAPLFSQLSASAIASSVGAFSLRAVNGVSTRAVQVRPEGVFPPGGMTSAAVQSTNQWTQTLSGYPFGGTGSYVANCSSFSGGGGGQTPWKAFDNNASTWWENNYVNGGTGYYDGIGPGNSNTYSGSFTTTVSGSSIAGEWLQLQLPMAIVLTSYSMYARFAWTFRMPYQFVIAGSNDGTTWTTVNSQNGINTWSGQTPITFTSTSPTPYSYFRLIVQAIVGAGISKQDVNIGQWTLYGSNPTWNTDFYADRLGNLLTQPVIGQSLANWIGSATGYVTTWYDQSGAGNHATQATAANQPVIQKATKGPGYACAFNANQFFTGMSYTVLNNTNYSFAVVERRQAATEMYSITSGNALKDAGFHLGYKSSTIVRFGQWTDDLDINPYPAYNATNEPLHYWIGTESSTSGRFLYDKTRSTVTTNSLMTALLNSTSGTFAIGSMPFAGVPKFTGEIYEILIFKTSLYDLDTTGGIITQIYNNQLSYTGT
jgi:hypothetical protein